MATTTTAAATAEAATSLLVNVTLTTLTSTFTTVTTAASTAAAERPAVAKLLGVSYLYKTVITNLVSVVVGVIVSLLTGECLGAVWFSNRLQIL